MRKLSVLILIMSLLIISTTLSGCIGFSFIQGTGPIVETTFDFKNFTEVEVSNAFEFTISRADTFSVTVSARESIVKYLDVTQTGQKVRVGLKGGSFSNADTKATITMPDLTSLVVSGASRGEAKGFQSSNALKVIDSAASQLSLNLEAGNTIIDVSGASQLTGTLKAQDVQITVSGASRCEIDGSAANATINVSGASRFPGSYFEVQNGNVTVSGASNAVVAASGDLSIDASGASTVEYSGSPNIKDLNVSGASRVNKR